MFPPVAGIIPIKVPIMLDLIRLPACSQSSRSVGNISLLVTCAFTASYEVLVPLSISGMAKNPIRAGITEIPLISGIWLNVNRKLPTIGSTPTKDSQSPTRPAIMPLVIDWPDMLAIIVRPMTASIAYSGGPNRSANLAACGAMRTNASQLMKPPTPEAVTAQPRALAAWPFLAMG